MFYNYDIEIKLLYQHGNLETMNWTYMVINKITLALRIVLELVSS